VVVAGGGGGAVVVVGGLSSRPQAARTVATRASASIGLIMSMISVEAVEEDVGWNPHRDASAMPEARRAPRMALK
jgi:hypothetical protein